MGGKNISRISSLQFGLLSQEEIRNQSVTEIVKQQGFHADSTPVSGGLFDIKMAPSSKDDICTTDNLSYDLTPGHFGNIELNVPVFHHFHINTIVQLLSVICIECGSLLHPPFSESKDFSKNT